MTKFVWFAAGAVIVWYLLVKKQPSGTPIDNFLATATGNVGEDGQADGRVMLSGNDAADLEA